MIFHNNILSKTLFMIMLLHKRCGGGILLKDINFLEIKRATLSHAYSATINKRNSSFKIFATSKIPSFCSRICLCCALFHIYDSFFTKMISLWKYNPFMLSLTLLEGKYLLLCSCQLFKNASNVKWKIIYDIFVWVKKSLIYNCSKKF